MRAAHAGELMVPLALAGKRVRVVGSADQPHSFTYVPDYARAMIAAARTPAAWDSVLHAPTGSAVTQRALVQAFAAAAATTAKVSLLPALVLSAGALVPGSLRELAETRYRFEAPFVTDSHHTEALLDLSPTPLPEAAAETVASGARPAVSEGG